MSQIAFYTLILSMDNIHDMEIRSKSYNQIPQKLI